MKYPTKEEIKQAYDAITRDGEGHEITIVLCSIVITDPLLRDTVERTAAHMAATTVLEKQAFIASSIAKGLNFGLRIAEARLAGAPKEHDDGRERLDDLPGSPEAVATAARLLRMIDAQAKHGDQCGPDCPPDCMFAE